MKDRFWIAALVLGSLALRLWFGPYTIYAADEAAIFEIARKFHVTGILPTHGAAVVYSGTAIPGSLLGLLTGLPLFLVGNHPIGSVISITLFNLLGLWMTFQILSGLFPRVSKVWLCALLFFAPWTLLMSNLWNPCYLVPFSALYLWGVFRLMKSPRDFLATAAIFFAIPMAFQLHLSVFALIAATGVAWLLRILPGFDWRGIIAGASTGSITLIPFLLSEATPKEKSVVTSNIQIHWENLLKLPAYFFRLLSFPSAEITRFLVGGDGYLSIGKVLNRLPVLWPFYLVAMAGSALLIWISFLFFLRTARPLARAYFSGRPWGSNLSLEQRRDLFCWVALITTGALFAASIKGPSAHTYWIWFPMTVYLVLRGLELSRRGVDALSTCRWQWASGAYFLSGAVVATLGYAFAIQLQRILNYQIP